MGSGFAWGTASVNVLGCLLFGIVWSMAEEGTTMSGETRAIILTGFMGAFTTFSTFIFESGEMIRDAQWLMALGNVAGQTVVGLAVFFAGLAIGRLL